MSLKKNDILKLTILSLSSEGSGVAKTDEGITVFVPNSAVGDLLLVRIVKVQKTYAFGKVEEILTPSPDRITPTCSIGVQCGGCVYCHISYEAELKAKEQRVRDAIERIAKLDIPVNPILSTGEVSRYRNKAMIPVGKNKDGKVTMGFYSKHSHRIIESDDCMLQPLCFLKATDILKAFIESKNITVYNEATGKGLIRHLYLRLAEKGDELMITIVINGTELPFASELVEAFKEALPNLKSVILNTNIEDTNVVLGKHSRVIYGDGFITDVLCGLKFMISPQSFYQVNRKGAELLYSKAAEYADLSGNEVLLDLYCGTGTIGLSMANKAKSLIGVEIVPKAIYDAKNNSKANGIKNARFIGGDAAKAAETLRFEGLTPDVIIIDPPRKGCDKSLIKTISDFNPNRVVYVSCDPATLARDLAVFAELGFKAHEVTPVDMFPRTAHVESVVRLSRTAI
ncbi:MAG: 23S rRNA (uracil(1939)-C(5))-methyltransferase RlmD [Ruminococcus sp.]|nr:23S rRNA (uracil(1939)-C(5))-methyltransferase RlmD [Ruminococcus sp.]